jgi:hypothetical protein
MKKVGHIAVRVNVYHVAGVTEMTAFDKAWIYCGYSELAEENS